MLKKTIKYTDYNGVKREEDFFFNLNKAELMEMEMGVNGGLNTMLTDIVKSQNVPEIIKIFKKIIMKAYGEKSADGKHFIKIDLNGNELAMNFAQTEAFSELFMELATDEKAATNFILGIMPGDMNINEEELKKLINENAPQDMAENNNE